MVHSMMVVLIVENAPDRLRGRITLWMNEISTCVYVTDCNSRLRDWIWSTVVKNLGKGSATMIWSTNRGEFGYDMRVVGNHEKRVTSIDGIKFMSRCYDG